MKKLFSLLLVVAMFASMSVVGFAATGTNDISVEVVETAEGIVATYYITNPTDIAGFTASLAFPTTLSTDKSYTLAADFTACSVATASKAGQVRFQCAFGSADNYVTATGKVAMISFPLTRTDADAVYTSEDFAYATGLYAAKFTVAPAVEYKQTTSAAAKYFAAPVYTDNRAPIVEEPDFTAIVDGTKITCAGKVDATVANYGVEFTAESTLDGARAQKYYGAMNGNTVATDGTATSTKVFTFGEWDGSFEIILEGVHAGTKVLNFFANDTVIADTEFTLIVE